MPQDSQNRDAANPGMDGAYDLSYGPAAQTGRVLSHRRGQREGGDMSGGIADPEMPLPLGATPPATVASEELDDVNISSRLHL